MISQITTKQESRYNGSSCEWIKALPQQTSLGLSSFCLVALQWLLSQCNSFFHFQQFPWWRHIENRYLTVFGPAKVSDTLLWEWKNCRHLWSSSTFFRLSSGYFPRHEALNGVINCSLVAVGLHLALKTTDLDQNHGCHPDGVTVFPFKTANRLTWMSPAVTHSHRPQC